jgi:hypothetical protein
MRAAEDLSEDGSFRFDPFKRAAEDLSEDGSFRFDPFKRAAEDLSEDGSFRFDPIERVLITLLLSIFCMLYFSLKLLFLFLLQTFFRNNSASYKCYMFYCNIA